MNERKDAILLQMRAGWGQIKDLEVAEGDFGLNVRLAEIQVYAEKFNEACHELAAKAAERVA